MARHSAIPPLELPAVGRLGAFVDPAWELRYQDYAWPDSVRVIRLCSLIGGSLFVLAGIADYMALGPGTPFFACLAARLAAFGVALYPWIVTGGTSYTPRVDGAVLSLELAFSLALVVVLLAKPDHAETLPLSFSILIVLFYVVPPARLEYLISGGVTASLLFLIFYGLVSLSATPAGVMVMLLLNMVIQGLCAVSVSRWNAVKRRSYAHMVHADELGRKYREVVENATEGIIVVVDEHIAYANPWICDTMGFSPAEAVGMHFLAQVYPEDRDIVARAHQGRLNGHDKSPRYRARFMDDRGELLWLEVGGVIIEWEGKKATLSFLMDVREQMAAQERELGQQKVAAAIQTAGAACHELNQPLQTILLHAELAMLGIDESHPLHHRLSKIIESANVMTKVTKSLIRITSFQTKNYVGSSRILDLARSTDQPEPNATPPAPKDRE